MCFCMEKQLSEVSIKFTFLIHGGATKETQILSDTKRFERINFLVQNCNRYEFDNNYFDIFLDQEKADVIFFLEEEMMAHYMLVYGDTIV